MRSRAHQQSQLTLSGVTKAYGDRVVLDQVSLIVRPGEKAAVIGENGSGKSTLLRLLAGAEAPDGGEVTAVFPGGTGHLAQTLDLAPGLTVQDAVDLALADLRELEARIRAAETALGGVVGEGGSGGEGRSGGGPDPALLDAYGDLLTAYEERGGYQADARTDAALHGLGLGHVTRDRTLGSLSGGECSRLALACVLAAAPELLLLDEPTNHLDRRAVDWLAERLRAHRGTLVVVTHDRDFLERITSTVLEVDRDRRTVVRYGDGWAGYLAAKAAARGRWAQRYAEWRGDLARTEALVSAAGQRLDRTGGDPGQGFGKHRRSSEAKLSGQVRAARTHLEQLRAQPVAPPPVPLRFGVGIATPEAGPEAGPETAPGPAPAGPLLQLSGIRVGDRLRIAALTVRPGQRLLVSGPNGAGKTTLLRVLAGDLTPDAGTVHRAAHVRLGYLAQELPHAPVRLPLLSAFAAGLPGLPEEHAEALLTLGLFREEDLPVPVAALSAGQRRRLELARLVTRPADVLVLDEPTNHVSLALVEEVEQALAGYPGAVVAVSHDPRFRAAFAGDRLELRHGTPQFRLVGTA
ncbi:ABC-F family ATP-binding cassette domain-containing protein [Streptomyces sp. NBC_01264]|uniref:ABC-F family ATP-binding cassette domain-containing protein n=1 Tax=Streptomyces sp. NBC_01264 TaxID=2903804 RepID=UPI00224CBB7A|nr:ABC-F family ATP-binding cassette domain-containing protein [Streptomyces sp. NBC_01264]MCX4777974.1 ATP-binding cassette domain-containing protein [Streptomyces sp. NBC_01264]